MARRAKAKKHFPDENRNRGMEHVSNLVRDSMEHAATRQGFATSMILTGWAEIAGPSIADVSTPVRISYNRDGGGATLILKVSGPRSQEVRMSAPRLIERINASYGYRAIDSIRITQVSGTGEGPTAAESTIPQTREPDAGKLRRLECSVEEIEDEQLRNMLFGLGKSVLGRVA